MPPAQAGPPLDASRTQLRTLLGPVVEKAGYDLEDVTVRAVGRRNLIRVTVDADGGVDLDGAAALSRAISDALDATPSGGADFAGAYVLEVTSPGVERPLTEPRHWRRATGRLVAAAVDGAPTTGRVLGADDDGAILERSGASEHVVWERLGPGKVQVEFNRAAAEGAQEGRG